MSARPGSGARARPGSGRALGLGARRIVLLSGLALIVLAGLVVVGGSWYYSDQIIAPAPRAPLETGLKVAALGESTITLAGTGAARHGQAWFLEWPGGAGVAGDVVALDAARVTRRFHAFRGHPSPGATVDLAAYPYASDPLQADGLAFDDVTVRTPLGGFPAWFVPGRRADWVIFVPGMTANRGQALQALPVVTGLGFPSLVISYRNAPGAPRGPDGLYHLGASEWQDLEGGVRYALAHGARRVILYGFSMGGAVVANFLRRSPLAESVGGVILDSPVLDWDAAVQVEAQRRHVPAWLTAMAEGLVWLRTGFHWDGPEGKVRATQFRTPVLLFHGRADRTVPIAASEALAAALGGRVTFVMVLEAGHVQSWNFDPVHYRAALREWLAQLVTAPTPS